MKTTNKDKNTLWNSQGHLESLRQKLHRQVSLEDVDSSWRLEALDRIVTVLQMDPAAFYQFWVQPLLAAGASPEVAYACIAESVLQPN
jgi:hypothetical protein